MSGGLVWGIVGTGRMARQMAAAIRSAPGHSVGAVVGRAGGSAGSLAAELGVAVHADEIAGLASAGVDVAYVASPNDLHGGHIAAARALGLPVLCEKPLAADAVAAADIAAAIGTGRPRVGVAFQYRQHPAHRRAKELIASGVLGTLRLVEVSACLPSLDVPAWYDDPKTSGGGILPMSGVHRVDLVRWIVGREFADVYATVGHHRAAPYDDTATIAARLIGGLGCTFQFGLDAPFGDDRIAVHGTTATLVLESTMSQWWSDDPGALTLRDAAGARTERFSDVDVYRCEVEDFAAFAAGEPSAIATAADAAAVAAFSEAVYRSADERRAIDLR